MKINFVYHTQPDNIFPYMFYTGMKDALEYNGYLHYSYDLCSKEMIDFKELCKYPVLFIRGYAKMYEIIVLALHGKQRMAMIETETIFNSDGSKNVVYDRMKMMESYFDTIFTESYLDGGYFGRKTQGYELGVPMRVYDSIKQEPGFDTGFVGNVRSKSRQEFVKNTPFIIHTNSAEKKTPKEHIEAYVIMMKRFKFLVSPSSSTAQSPFSYRTHEAMACKRLCFAYYSGKHMVKTFEDKKELVYWNTYEELQDLINYYSEHEEEADKIAQAGYNRIKKDYNEDVTVKSIVGGIYDIQA